ncbi:MAG: hypothetical protein ACI9U0_001197 [Flavobacteriales bacterium]|jgi:hypothetical protein|tara:strand:+ start:2178 stop:2555 length:378 start_codon:yes stop_codon:yes gene_type:complete
MKKFLFTILIVSTCQLFAQTGCLNPLSEPDFTTAYNQIKAHDFDEAKKTDIEELFSSKCLTTNQISKLLKVLSFEVDKLDLAKKAYSKVADPENFKSINSIFDFDDSKNELQKFIEGKQSLPIPH